MQTKKSKPMLSKDKIISIFCLIDDILEGIEHKGDIRRRVSDSENILTAIDSSTSFYGNHSSAIKFLFLTITPR